MTRIVSKSWCFTVPNYEDVHERAVQDLVPLCSTIVVGREQGASGFGHLQGCLVFRVARSMSCLQRLLLGPWHCEVTRDQEAAKTYCRKEGNLLVDVDGRNGQGARTDLTALREALDSGGLPEAKRSCPEAVIKYPGGCKLYVSIRPFIDRPKPRVYIFCGDSGIGKSRTARSAGTQLGGVPTDGIDTPPAYPSQDPVMCTPTQQVDPSGSMATTQSSISCSTNTTRVPCLSGFCCASSITGPCLCQSKAPTSPARPLPSPSPATPVTGTPTCETRAHWHEDSTNSGRYTDKPLFPFPKLPEDSASSSDDECKYCPMSWGAYGLDELARY